jgi:hypothetical protein
MKKVGCLPIILLPNHYQNSVQLTHVVIERSAQKQAEYVYKIGLYYSADQLVFVDESSCDRRTTYRGKAWQSKGNVPSERHSLFEENGMSFISSMYFPLMLQSRYSILPALSLDGMLTVSIVEGSFNQVSFGDFIEGVLDQMNLFPATNSIIIMDNC